MLLQRQNRQHSGGSSDASRLGLPILPSEVPGGEGVGEEGTGHLLAPLGTAARSLGRLQAAALPEAAHFSSSFLGSVSGLLLLRMQTLMVYVRVWVQDLVSLRHLASRSLGFIHCKTRVLMVSAWR